MPGSDSPSPSSTSIYNPNDEAYPRKPTRNLLSCQSYIITIANILLFLISVALFIVLPHRHDSTQPNHAYRQVSTWCTYTRFSIQYIPHLQLHPANPDPPAPILDSIELPFINKTISGSLFPSTNTTDQLLRRLEPGPQTDSLWLDYEIQRPFVLTRSQVLALGKDPALTVKYPDSIFHLGDEAYMGGMDVFHLLHCFNTIRQEAFKDYYFDGEKYHMEGYSEESRPRRRHAEMFWIHLRHCTDIIVQFIMCNADATMTTMTWLETQERPWPEFSVNKKCIDFDALVKWRDENAVDIEKAGLVRRPEGAREVKVDEMYWRIMGNETYKGDNRHHPLWD
ncbi:hypothetical protein Plec18167_009522 [Paecilomyces lecythidis]|uniref:Uncharacterized protein n=1 Tax=Paecilomyces lecythidis TaxID=3004212 RepID=A0ABR3WN92_9EURO